MNFSTLTFYTLSAGLCFSLGLVMIAYAHLRGGTILVRNGAQVMLLLAVAFFLAGHGASVAWWVTRIGTNILLLAGAVLFFSAFRAYLQESTPQVDRFGTTLVALTIPPFYWWGLVEPDGVMRSIIFSGVSALLNGRITWVLGQIIRQRRGGLPAQFLAALFATATLWMLGRTISLLLSDPLPAAQQGDNPTTWITVFWFNVLASSIAATLLAMENHRRNHPTLSTADGQLSSDRHRGNLLLLWTLVAVTVLTIVAEVAIAYSVFYQREYQQLQQKTRLANQALVEYTEQVIGQVDTLIRTARGLIELNTHTAELEQFIDKLDLPRTLIEDIFILGADGKIILPQAKRQNGPVATQRDYFQYHLAQPADQLFISPVSVGQVTGKWQFRLSRRIFAADGSFAGVILIPLEPQALTRLYRRLQTTDDAVATLIGVDDRKIRARAPHVDNVETYQNPLNNTPLWEMLANERHGSYQSSSQVDGIERALIYQQVGTWPLLMLSGFSMADVHRNTLQSIQPVGLGALLAIAVVIALATILALLIRQREEQDRFFSMLSHELKTPLAVIRLSLDQDTAASRERVTRNLADIDAIVERCLQSDRLQHERIAITPTPCHIGALLQRLIANSTGPSRIALDCPPALPTCTTDTQLLGIILANLIDNALKYGSQITASARQGERYGQPGISIEICNQPGPAGMPDPQQVFRKYYRAPGAHAKTGSGLGLHLAEAFARKLGGELRYSPTTDTVKFALWIPI